MNERRIERSFRARRLTPEEAARDNEIRQKVQQEFPPVEPQPGAHADLLATALRQAIRDSHQSVYQIAQASGVSQIVISRFLSGQRDIRLHTADRLAAVLGLRLSLGTLQ